MGVLFELVKSLRLENQYPRVHDQGSSVRRHIVIPDSSVRFGVAAAVAFDCSGTVAIIIVIPASSVRFGVAAAFDCSGTVAFFFVSCVLF